MTKQQVKTLLESLKFIKLPEGSVPADKFAENVYATPKGKEVIDTFNANEVTAEKLRKWGFIAAYISLSTKLKLKTPA